MEGSEILAEERFERGVILERGGGAINFPAGDGLRRDAEQRGEILVV